ncbi:MAG: Tripartite ATP-independent periplasmic transporter [Syntrophorhabdus sp. PtaU1.Bin058]|nr:MAG: Tripartite ATP-independent periplasmic transporter [Syntrophorhabdus sp. PtaU1.Bin058]
MNPIFTVTKTLVKYLHWIAGIALVCLMLLTVFDVVGRAFNRPITGVYDLTVLLGAVVIGFAIPMSTQKHMHVYMEFFVDSVPLKWKKTIQTFTYCLGIFLFLLIGWNLMKYGLTLYQRGEVSSTIYIPIYPVVLGMGVSFFLNCFVLLRQLTTVFGKEEEA